MVLFVEPDGARSLIREMPLNERGELVKAWPGGFFEEGYVRFSDGPACRLRNHAGCVRRDVIPDRAGMRSPYRADPRAHVDRSRCPRSPSGEWRRSFDHRSRTWHRRGMELIRKLTTQGRLIQFPSTLSASPSDDQDWCVEALDSHLAQEFTGGIIVTESVKTAYRGESLVARIDRLGSAPWWRARSPSVTLSRTLADYADHLEPVLRCSNSLMFIDPHLDPMQARYCEFGNLVEMAGRRQPRPTIEIHRVCYEGSGRERQFPTRNNFDYFKQRFHSGLSARFRAAELTAEVFIWDDFHDRYLISNLIGISLPNGFDTTRNRDSITRWTRLGRIRQRRRSA